MILEMGRVKVTRIDAGGHETLLSILDPGDIIGELALIDEGTRLAGVTALEPVRALVVASSVFRSWLETTPRVAVALLEVVTERLRDTTLKRAQFSSSDTVGRLAARLVELAERYGTRGDNGIEIELALSQEELAAWTGASHAGVAKALQTLRELGWIETHRRRIVVRQLEAVRKRAP
jgi:CRP-like cAMP-binding protein